MAKGVHTSKATSYHSLTGYQTRWAGNKARWDLKSRCSEQRATELIEVFLFNASRVFTCKDEVMVDTEWAGAGKGVKLEVQSGVSMDGGSDSTTYDPKRPNVAYIRTRKEVRTSISTSSTSHGLKSYSEHYAGNGTRGRPAAEQQQGLKVESGKCILSSYWNSQ